MGIVEDTVLKQNTYAGLKAWHDAGFTGQGVVVWNTESAGTEHGDIVQRRISDACPGCTIVRGGLEMSSDGTHVIYSRVKHSDGTVYNTEDYIKKFNVKVITRSVGGGTATGNPESLFWLALRDKYDLVFYNAAGNDSTDGCGGSLPPDVAYYIAACKLNSKTGRPRRDGYSSIGEEVDFCNFVAIWDGTSFAAPYTAGETALLMGRYGQDMNHEEVFKYFVMISENMEEAGYDTKTGYGIPIFRPIDKTYITLTVGNQTYKVDGVQKTMDTAPVNKEGNVFVPVRVVAEGLGKTVNYVVNANKTITVTITDGTNTVVLTTGSTTMKKNGTSILLNFAPYIDENNRTLVPIRAIAEAFNCNVDWIQSKKKVMILEK